MADLSLEIHHLDVRGGDATAVIVKEHGDTDMATGKEEIKEVYRMLIDAGAETGGSAALQLYLETYLPGPFDLIVATHYHQDHIQGFPQAGITYKAFLDNGSYKDATSFFEPINDIGRGSRTKIFRFYGSRTQEGLVDDPVTPGAKAKPQRKEIPFIKKGFGADGSKAQPLVIPLGDTGITLTCYCANGILANGKNVLKKQRDARRKAINPNDVSLALVLEWGDFRYLTAGDLSGATESKSYYDIESKLVAYLTDPVDGPLKNKPITVFKASHHGSQHSNQNYLFEKLKPETVVVSCNLQKRVPSSVFLDRLKTHFASNNAGAIVFTNTMKTVKNKALYPKLVALRSYIAKGNVDFPDAGVEVKQEALSNLKIKTAIIRRRMVDGAYKADKNIPAGATRIEKTGYDIILTKRDDADAKEADTLKFIDYDFGGIWLESRCNRTKIEVGAINQATAMIQWLQQDATPDVDGDLATEGIDYIRFFYPALVEIAEDVDEENPNYLEMKKALKDAMLDMFDRAFKKIWVVDAFSFKWDPDNDLSQDEKMTLHNLLRDNFHQIDLAQAYPIFRPAFKAAQCWNYKTDPEPYLHTQRSKQTLDEANNLDRPAKKQKT